MEMAIEFVLDEACGACKVARPSFGPETLCGVVQCTHVGLLCGYSGQHIDPSLYGAGPWRFLISAACVSLR